MFPTLLFGFQLIEFICYVNLYLHLLSHSKEMLMSQVITRETFVKRKGVRTFSLFAQFLGFTVEVIYLLVHSSVKWIGHRFFNANILEFVNALKTSEFGAVSTVEIMATSEMRKKFLSVFKRH